jgi:hypothetical protein
LHCRKSADCIIGTNVGQRENWPYRECRIQLPSERKYLSLAGELPLRPFGLYTAKSNALTNAGRTATEVKSPD